MQCPKCGSANVSIQAVTTVKNKKHGIMYYICFIWLFDLLIWIFLFLPRLIIQMLKKNKVVSKTRSVAVCQNCGNRWNV